MPTTKEAIAKAGASLAWLADEHRRLVSGLQRLRGSMSIADLASATKVPQHAINAVLRGEKVVRGEEAKPYFNAIKAKPKLVDEWMEHSSNIPNHHWLRLIFKPDLIEVFCEAQCFMLDLPLEKPLHSFEVLAECIAPGKPDPLLVLLRLASKSFDEVSKPETVAWMRGLFRTPAPVIANLKAYNVGMSVFRTQLLTAVQAVRGGDDQRFYTRPEIAKITGYTLTTVQQAFVNTPETLRTLFQIYEKLCAHAEAQPSLAWPTAAGFIALGLERDGKGDAEQCADRSEDDPPPVHSEPSAPASADAEDAEVPVARDHNLDRAAPAVLRAVLWKALCANLPRTWTTLAELQEISGADAESIFAAVQGAPDQAELLDCLIAVLSRKALSCQLAVPYLIDTSRPASAESIIAAASYVLGALRNLLERGQTTLPGLNGTALELESLLFELHEQIEVFVSGNPTAMAAVMRDQQAYLKQTGLTRGMSRRTN